MQYFCENNLKQNVFVFICKGGTTYFFNISHAHAHTGRGIVYFVLCELEMIMSQMM